MDPLTASTTLATLVGLICSYKQEYGAKKDLDHRNFIEWLQYHRHEEIKNLIVNTQSFQDEVNQLLRQDHTEILKKLDVINAALSQVLSRISGFEIFAQKLGNNSKLSDQALAILQQFTNSTSQEMACNRSNSMLWFLPIPSGSVSVSDKRFLFDDLQVLESFGFIKQVKFHGDGGTFTLTRNGAAYAKAAVEIPISAAP